MSDPSTHPSPPAANDDDDDQDALMRAMGFSAFGGPDNRPKHSKPSGGGSGAPAVPPATGANAAVVREGGRFDPRKRQRVDGGEGRSVGGAVGMGGGSGVGMGAGLGSSGGGGGGGGGWQARGEGQGMYKASFVEDPWKGLLSPEENDWIPLTEKEDGGQ